MKTTIVSARALLLCSVVLFAPVSLSAQDNPNAQRGVETNSPYALGQLDAINTFTGNLTIRIPLGINYPINGGFSYGLTLNYNAQVWNRRPTAEGYALDPNPETNAGLGWQLSLGRLSGPGQPPFNFGTQWQLIEPDGTKRTFFPSLHLGEPQDPAVFYSRDGSYHRMTCFTSAGAFVPCDSSFTIHVESPDGLKRIFWGPTAGSLSGQLSVIRDVFGNSVVVDRFADHWSLTDGHNRVHRVYFAACDQARTCVTQVQLQSFAGGPPATYVFNYQTQNLQPNTDPPAPHALLTRLDLPDGSSFAMTYHLTGDEMGGEGALASITLPTLGKYEYTYTEYAFGDQFPEIATSVGVSTKRARNRSGALQGTWIHQSFKDLGALSHAVRDVTDPEGNRTRSHFRDRSDQSLWDHGLPMSPDPNETDGNGRFLSTQTYDNLGFLVRSEYSRFNADQGSTAAHGHRRLESSRVVFHDDGGRVADLDLSDFDGFGHYRTAQTNGSFDGSNSRTETTSVNSGSTYTCSPGGSCTSTVVIPSRTSPWLLNKVTEARTSEFVAHLGTTQVFVTQYCVDSLGFRTRERVLAGPAPGGTDVLRVYTPAANGNLIEETHHGGDPGGVPTSGSGGTGIGAPCSIAPPTAQYRMAHLYNFGSLSESAYTDGVSKLFLTVDRNIDPSTGLTAVSRDSAGVPTTFVYDAMGRLTQASPADMAIETVTYPLASGTTSQAKVIRTHRENGATRALHEYWFDDFGRLERERKNKPSITVTGRQRTYNAMGWLKTVSEWGTTSFKTTYSNFDAFGRPRRVEGPDHLQRPEGSVVTLSYSGVRQIARTSSIDGVLSTKTERYDRHGRLHSVTEPSNNNIDFTTTYAYDAGNRLALVTQGVQSREFQYDGRGFLLRERLPEKVHPTDPTWDVLYSNYDSRGHAGRRDDAGRVLTYTVDQAERPTFVHRQPSNTVLKRFSYYTSNNGANKGQGKLRFALRNNYVRWTGTTLEDTVTVEETYEYRGRGGRPDRRDTRVDWPEGVPPVTQTHRFTETFSYTALGDIDQITYPCQGTGPNPFSCVSSGDPAPQRIVDYNYHSNSGFLSTVVGVVPAVTYAASIAYHDNLQLSRVDFASFFGAYHRDRDPSFMQRPATIGADFYPNGPTMPRAVVKLAMTYDGSGNLVTQGDNIFDYDKANRIIHHRFGNAYEQFYTYDQYGNITGITSIQDYNLPLAGLETGNRTFTHNVANNQLAQVNETINGVNQPILQIRYDNNLPSNGPGPGSITRYGNTLYEWDTAGMMTQLKSDGGGNTNGFRYIYTAADERLATRKWVSGAPHTSWFLRDLGGKVLREYLYQGTIKTWVRDYTYQNGLMLTVERLEGGPLWPIVDHLGTPVVYQDINHAGSIMGSFLFPYGEDQITKNQNDIGSPKRFTGHERDQNLSVSDIKDDLDYMHARHYSPHLGRFLSADPIHSHAARSPLSWNKFGYARGNPVGRVDPDGEQDIPELPGNPSGLTSEESAGLRAGYTQGLAIAAVVDFTIASLFVPLTVEDIVVAGAIRYGLPVASTIARGLGQAGSVRAVTQAGVKLIKDIKDGTKTLDSVSAAQRAEYAADFDKVSIESLFTDKTTLSRAQAYVFNRERARFMRGERATRPDSAAQTAAEFPKDIRAYKGWLDFMQTVDRMNSSGGP